MITATLVAAAVAYAVLFGVFVHYVRTVGSRHLRLWSVVGAVLAVLGCLWCVLAASGVFGAVSQ
jgi:hypothetical protein